MSTVQTEVAEITPEHVTAARIIRSAQEDALIIFLHQKCVDALQGATTEQLPDLNGPVRETLAHALELGIADDDVENWVESAWEAVIQRLIKEGQMTSKILLDVLAAARVILDAEEKSAPASAAAANC